MGHDVHFLQRVGDRARGGDVDFLLGLYRDHEFVRYLLGELKVGPDVAAVALAVADDGPYAIVARSGHFVTCLDRGMHLKDALLVPRGKIDALFAKDQKMRERRALAVERGLDDQRAIAKLETTGPALAREDFVATAGLLGPATTVLTETYATCAFQIADIMPHLMGRDLDPKLRRDWHRELAQHVWGMTHAALMHVDNVSRDWVEQWAELPAHARGSPWLAIVKTFEVPMAARAAWLAGRLGKVFFPFYRQRFAGTADPFDLLEAGWGLVAMGMRHAGLRGDVIRALRAAPPEDAPGNEHLWIFRDQFATTAQVLESGQEETFIETARATGRQEVCQRTAHLEPGSRYRFDDPASVPDELALPTMLQMPFESLHLDSEEGFKLSNLLTLSAVLASARWSAESFYLPATFLHARGPENLEEHGARLAGRRRDVLVSGRHLNLPASPKVGRNEPCPCGSGKKFKKCCYKTPRPPAS